MNIHRRRFVKNTAQLAIGGSLLSAAGAPVSVIKPIQKKYAPNETIRLGLIGCRNMGWADLTELLKHQNTDCIALCDVDSTILNSRAAELEKGTGKKALLYSDFRKLLDNKDIDAVIIGTPDHWHCLQMIYACEAGKDVYVEKPIAKTIEECNLMVAAARRYNRVVQVGQWQRSDPHWIVALDLVRSGKLGKIRSSTTWALTSYGRSFPVKGDEPVPAGVDYDMWLGPAPLRPFNPNRFHGSFRYYWDYAGGLMTDWGVHMIDMVLSAMNVTIANSVAAVGGNYGFADNDYETPETMQAIFDFKDFSMLWEHSLGTASGGPYNHREPGVAFIGNNGTLVIDRNKWEVLPEVEEGKTLIEAPAPQTNNSSGLNKHTLNFLECIKSRQPTNCTIEMGRNTAVNALVANVAFRSGRKVLWDHQSNSFQNDADANKFIKAHYRSPWKVPKV